MKEQFCSSYMTGQNCDVTFMNSLSPFFVLFSIMGAVTNSVLALSGTLVIYFLEMADFKRLRLNMKALVEIFYVLGAAAKTVAWIFITYSGHKNAFSAVDLFFLFFLHNFGAIVLVLPPWVLYSTSCLSKLNGWKRAIHEINLQTPSLINKAI